MRSFEGSEATGASRRGAPPAAACGSRSSASGRVIGPIRAGPGYSPWKDPTVLLLLAISLLAAVMFVGGATVGPALAGDGDDDGVFPVIDILAGDDGDDPALFLEANRTELDVGERVAFTVTTGNDTPAGDASVAVAGRTHRVDGDGQVVVRIESAGELTATARAPGLNESTVESDDLRLSVAPRTVALAVRANRSAVTVGEPTALTLVRADTGGAVRGELAAAVVPPGGLFDGAGPWSGIRRGNGTQLVLRPEHAGRIYVRGARADARGETYADAHRWVSVERRTVPLSLAVDPGGIVAGESTTATVRRTDTGERVAATLQVEDRTVETGEDGSAELAFETAGNRTIEATAASRPAIRFEADEAEVTVRRRQVDLELSPDRPAITDGGYVTLQLTRADTGEPIGGVVSWAGGTFGTGDDGTYRTKIEVPGEYEFEAVAPHTDTETFSDARTTVSVANATIDMELLEGPDTVAPGATFTVSVRASNRGPETATDTMVVVVGSEQVGSEAVTLAPGNETTVTFEVTAPEDTGDWNLIVAGSEAVLNEILRIEE